MNLYMHSPQLITACLLLILGGCGKSNENRATRPFERVEFVDAIAQASFNDFATIGCMEVDSRILSGTPNAIGRNGWEVDASFGESAYFLFLEPLDADQVEVSQHWSACLSSFLEDGVDADGWDQLLPPFLGDPTIWVLKSDQILGLFFVNTDEVGVMLLLSRDTKATMTVLLYGVKVEDPANTLQNIASHMRFKVG